MASPSKSDFAEGREKEETVILIGDSFFLMPIGEGFQLCCTLI